MKRHYWIILLIALVHMAISVGGTLFAFSYGMEGFDTGEVKPFASLLSSIFLVMYYPVMGILRYTPGLHDAFPGLWGYIPIYINSILWASAIYYIYRKIKNRKVEASGVAQ